MRVRDSIHKKLVMNSRIAYCPECDKFTRFSIKHEMQDVTVLEASFKVKLWDPYCKECGSLLDVPWIERKNTILIEAAYDAALKQQKGKKK